MAFCGKCGTQLGDGMRFCPNCGAPIEAQEQLNQNSQSSQNNATSQMNDIGAKIAGLSNTTDSTTDFNQQDIESNKVMAVLAYFGPLVLVPIFAASESKYARYHANQGLLLLILEFTYGVVQAILMVVLLANCQFNWNYGYFGGRGAIYNFISSVLGLAWIVVVVLMVLGIVNAVQGRAKELPVIGKFRLLK
ncbi:MAG TPA: zinc ribbon domain-containing protein [Lachnospiraceae bacterium]|nr:zinc ribbon domain-containing protein [Lachnospiraceae bacterium]